MSYTNSPLVNYTKISPNRTANRNHAIDTITIHCVVGQCTVEALGNVFTPTSRKASANYGIGYDGRIGMYCEEKDRSWCTSSADNDNRAITIEVASDTKHPYAVTDKAYAALINLVADICKRNGITQLLWQADKALMGQVGKQNMTVHRWLDNVQCPGDYLYSRYGDIAAKVNEMLIVEDVAIKVGDTVRITGDTYSNGATVPKTVKNSTHVVAQIKGGRALLGYPVGIMSWVNLSGLETVKTAPAEPVETKPAAPTPTAPTEPTAIDRAIAKGIVSATDNLDIAVTKRDVVMMLDKLGMLE